MTKQTPKPLQGLLESCGLLVSVMPTPYPLPQWEEDFRRFAACSISDGPQLAAPSDARRLHSEVRWVPTWAMSVVGMVPMTNIAPKTPRLQ